MSILIVDANPANLKIIGDILKQAGYHEFSGLRSSSEMFERLQRNSESSVDPGIQLILMDMMLPEIDGIEATRRIQQDERWKDIPIIIVTALGDSNKLAEALDAGANDYVMKPINKIELLARIRAALRLKVEKDWRRERDKKFRTELKLAKQVQASILSVPIRNEKVEIAAAYHPSSELAGDLYTWYRIDQHRYGVIVLDMMGHGISSSLVCMFISSILKDTINRLADPALVISELNRHMSQLYIKNQFIQYYCTAIYVLIDTKRQIIEYVNAGHPPGLLFQQDGSTVRFDRGCCAIGLFPQIEVEKSTISYNGQTKLVLYTDGLIDEFAAAEEDVFESLLERIEQSRDDDLDILMHKLMPEGRTNQRRDDICFVMVDLKPRDSEPEGSDTVRETVN